MFMSSEEKEVWLRAYIAFFSLYCARGVDTWDRVRETARCAGKSAVEDFRNQFPEKEFGYRDNALPVSGPAIEPSHPQNWPITSDRGGV